MTATIYNNPNSGGVGKTITVLGNGFTPSDTITVKYDGGNTLTTTSDSNGAFSQTLTIPESIAGKHQITATDTALAHSAESDFFMIEYCQISDICDWLSVDINANTKPNKLQVINWILFNQQRIDQLTGHSWQTRKVYTWDQSDVAMGWYDYGRGMEIFLKHRQVQEFDTTKGDKVEIWNGISWQDQGDLINNHQGLVYVDPVRGAIYFRGFLYTILTRNRFRFTYRYGGSNEGPTYIPPDITKCAMLMTSVDILSRDFRFSQLPYGGEGNVSKIDMMNKWKEEIDNIIWTHAEIHTVM